MRPILILLCLLALAARAELIKFADGREVEARVLRQTEDSITLAAGNEIVKFKKSELHADTLAKYPVPAPVPEEPLPPEPENLERTGPGRRSITREIHGKPETWSLSLYTGGRQAFVLSYRRGPFLKIEKDYYISVYPRDLGATFELMAKALDWSDAARAAKAPDFKKQLGETSVDTWRFEWAYGRATVYTGSEFLNEDDLQNFSTLLLASAHVARETYAEEDKGKEFAEKLK